VSLQWVGLGMRDRALVADATEPGARWLSACEPEVKGAPPPVLGTAPCATITDTMAKAGKGTAESVGIGLDVSIAGRSSAPGAVSGRIDARLFAGKRWASLIPGGHGVVSIRACPCST